MTLAKDDIEPQEGSVLRIAAATDTSRMVICFEDDPAMPEHDVDAVYDWLKVSRFKHTIDNVVEKDWPTLRETYITFEDPVEAMLFRMAHNCA
jgi:hypothetical protein